MANTIFKGVTDYLGRLLKARDLGEEQATPTATGVRSVFTEGVVSGLTPQKLGEIFKASSLGDTSGMLALAEEMEEREPHYASVLQTRKLAVIGVEPVVEAASDDAKDVELADHVRALVTHPAFEELQLDALDGLGKGYAVVEIDWQPGLPYWKPKSYTWRDPRHFQFGPDGRSLRLRKDGSKEGEELAPGRFLIHVPKLKSGLPARAGLARLAAWSFMIKHYGLKDWAEFCEAYGKPIRLGKFGKNATPKEKSALLRALRSIGKDFAAIIPEDMDIRFETSPAKAGGALFKELLTYLDGQLSKAILGQTMTTDNGSSKAQAEVHNEVRMDIVRADAKQLAATINRDVIRPFIDINFGPQENYPELTFPVTEAEDITALVDNVAKLVPYGLTVEASVMRDRMGLPDPAKGKDVELIRARPSSGNPGNNPAGSAANRRGKLQTPCPSCGKAHNRIGDELDEDEFDELTEDALTDWQEQLDPLLEPIRKAANSVSSYEEFRALLPGIVGEQDVSALAGAMTRAMFKSLAHGDADPADDAV